jgi:peptide deformylase
MDIVLYPDPVLRRGGKEVTVFDAALRETAARMIEAMYGDDGCGLAAPQVGIELKLLVLNPTADPNDRSQEMVLVNPKVTHRKGSE